MIVYLSVKTLSMKCGELKWLYTENLALGPMIVGVSFNSWTELSIRIASLSSYSLSAVLRSKAFNCAMIYLCINKPKCAVIQQKKNWNQKTNKVVIFQHCF